MLRVLVQGGGGQPVKTDGTEILIEREMSTQDEALAGIIERRCRVPLPLNTPKERLRGALALAFPDIPAVEVDCLLAAAPMGTPIVVAYARVLQALVFYYHDKPRPTEWRATSLSRREAIAHLKRELNRIESEER